MLKLEGDGWLTKKGPEQRTSRKGRRYATATLGVIAEYPREDGGEWPERWWLDVKALREESCGQLMELSGGSRVSFRGTLKRVTWEATQDFPEKVRWELLLERIGPYEKSSTGREKTGSAGGERTTVPKTGEHIEVEPEHGPEPTPEQAVLLEKAMRALGWDRLRITDLVSNHGVEEALKICRRKWAQQERERRKQS